MIIDMLTRSLKNILASLFLILPAIATLNAGPSDETTDMRSRFRIWKSKKILDENLKGRLEEGLTGWNIKIGQKKLSRYGIYESEWMHHDYRFAIVWDSDIDPELTRWFEGAKAKFRPEDFKSEKHPQIAFVQALIDYVKESLPDRSMEQDRSPGYYPLFLGDMIKEKMGHPIAQEAALRLLFFHYGIDHDTRTLETHVVLDQDDFLIRALDLNIFKSSEFMANTLEEDHFLRLDKFDIPEFFRTSNTLLKPFSCLATLINFYQSIAPVRKNPSGR